MGKQRYKSLLLYWILLIIRIIIRNLGIKRVENMNKQIKSEDELNLNDKTIEDLFIIMIKMGF